MNLLGIENILIVLIATALVLALIVSAVLSYIEFKDELNYINGEIHRTDGAARKHWKKARRRLWLSLLPFFRR